MDTCPHCGWGTSASAIAFAGHRFDAVQGVLVAPDGRVSRFTRTEGKLFEKLAENGAKGRIATKASIYDALYWDRGESAEPCEKIVDVMVCKVRKKLPPSLTIETLWGRGWKLVVKDAGGETVPVVL